MTVLKNTGPSKIIVGGLAVPANGGEMSLDNWGLFKARPEIEAMVKSGVLIVDGKGATKTAPKPEKPVEKPVKTALKGDK